ncbi:MAG TPA: hypothetical protein VKA53_03365 [Thermoanaerobaculia bacterium]|nr:hypothetical protein [Thermoanaerobaculia bacterium]
MQADQVWRDLFKTALVGIAVALVPGALHAGDVTITPASNSDSVVINDSSSAARLQVRGDGAVFLPGLAAGSSGVSPLCYDSASTPSGQVVTCPAPTAPTPSYAFVSDSSAAPILPGADLDFGNVGSISGVLYNAVTGQLTMTQAGAYKIDYRVSAAVGAGTTIAIAKNGVIETDTEVPILQNSSNAAGSAILQLLPGDVVTIRNSGIQIITLAAPPAVGAAVVLTKLN